MPRETLAELRTKLQEARKKQFEAECKHGEAQSQLLAAWGLRDDYEAQAEESEARARAAEHLCKAYVDKLARVNLELIMAREALTKTFRVEAKQAVSSAKEITECLTTSSLYSGG